MKKFFLTCEQNLLLLPNAESSGSDSSSQASERPFDMNSPSERLHDMLRFWGVGFTYDRAEKQALARHEKT